MTTKKTKIPRTFAFSVSTEKDADLVEFFQEKIAEERISLSHYMRRLILQDMKKDLKVEDNLITESKSEYKDANKFVSEWFEEKCQLDDTEVLIPNDCWKSFREFYKDDDGLPKVNLSVNKFKSFLQTKLNSKITAHRVNGIVRKGIRGAKLID